MRCPIHFIWSNSRTGLGAIAGVCPHLQKARFGKPVVKFSLGATSKAQAVKRRAAEDVK